MDRQGLIARALANRFFGRKAEVCELVEKFKRHRVVAIVADSGAGKSSLAQAGLIRAFRGGALADASRDEPEEKIWHVVVMRPGSDPVQGLKDGITERERPRNSAPAAGRGRRHDRDAPAQVSLVRTGGLY